MIYCLVQNPKYFKQIKKVLAIFKYLCTQLVLVKTYIVQCILKK